MSIINIKGSTYYIKGGTNTGVYLFEDNTALMIDPGLSGLRPKRVIQMLEERNINLKYIINTHEHNDHYGACNQFREHYKDLYILSSEYTKLYIEHPELFSKYIMGGKSNTFMDGKLKGKSLDNVKINNTVNEGLLSINGEAFEVIKFPGHTPGSIGILTKDKVLFVGDLLVGEEMLAKYDFLFLFDVQEQIISLEKIKNIDYDYIVPGHSKKVISKEDSYNLIDNHKRAIDKYLLQIREGLSSPITLEKLLKDIIKNNNLSNNYKEYHFFKASLVSVLSYLIELDEIEYILSEGELLYYTKKN